MSVPTILWRILLCTVFLVPPALAEPLSHSEALLALEHPVSYQRLAALQQLGRSGTMADAGAVLGRLHDGQAEVREAAAAAAWQIWGRSGDTAVDALYAKGVTQMQAGEVFEALETFEQVIRRKPDFAEGWNKRATVLYALGRFEESLRDCVEVFKRNPQHFGALSGAGQIYLQLGQWRQALTHFRLAVAVNPNLEGPAQIIPLIEERIAEEDKKRT